MNLILEYLCFNKKYSVSHVSYIYQINKFALFFFNALLLICLYEPLENVNLYHFSLSSNISELRYLQWRKYFHKTITVITLKPQHSAHRHQQTKISKSNHASEINNNLPKNMHPKKLSTRKQINLLYVYA